MSTESRAERREKRPDALRSVLGFVGSHWRRQPWRVASIAGAGMAATLADVLMPWYAGRLIDALTTLGDGREAARDAALHAFVAMAILGVAMVVMRHLAWSGIIPLTLRMMSEIAQEAFHRVQRFSADWHANTFAGSTVRKITRGMWALDILNDTLLMALLPSAVVLTGTMIMLGLQWPVMGMVMGVGSAIFVGATVLVATRYIAPAARLSNSWDTRLGGTVADAVSCNAVVKAFGAEAREETLLGRVIAKWRRRVARTWMRHTYNGTGQMAVLLLVRFAVVGTALWLWWQGRATPGDVAYVLTTYFVMHGYLRDIGQHINHLQRSVNDMEELVSLHAQPLGVDDRPGAQPIEVAAGEVVFDKVTFHYKAQAMPLYTDLSVNIRAGERIGLVGRSGSGKTTFVKLIQRLYDVTEGQIRIDGQDVSMASQSSLRAQIAIVQQEPILFHRSLAENIAYARPGASMAEIEQAARQANAHEFIERLPKGYGTLVGERGVKLSGGERQRVALARAFLANAPILILDEATSSLDSESEALVQEAMERLMRGRTAIVIAHRLSTVRNMDRLLVFDRGRIAEEGTHATLLRRPDGIYRKLFEKQVGDEATKDDTHALAS